MGLESIFYLIASAAASTIVNKITNKVIDHVTQRCDQYINGSALMPKNEEFEMINKDDIPQEAITLVQNNFTINNINVINIIGGESFSSSNSYNVSTNSDYIMELPTSTN